MKKETQQLEHTIEINKIYCESNLETMSRMPDDFVDLTVTSPPYDGLRTYNGYSFPFEDIAKELYRVVKDGGVVAWIVGDATIDGSETGTSFKQALYFKEVGFFLHDTMIYERVSPFPMDNRYHPSFEVFAPPTAYFQIFFLLVSSDKLDFAILAFAFSSGGFKSPLLSRKELPPVVAFLFSINLLNVFGFPLLKINIYSKTFPYRTFNEPVSVKVFS